MPGLISPATQPFFFIRKLQNNPYLCAVLPDWRILINEYYGIYEQRY